MSFRAEFLAFADIIEANSRLRLAPTPSGFLHSGNALNFTLNWLAARLQPGAKLLLRIDDLDADRKRPEYVTNIFDSLHWLGLNWDEGPKDADDFEQNWSQVRRLPLYVKALEQVQDNNLVFACAKSRRDLVPFDGKYPPEFRNQNLSLNAPNVAWRAFTPPEFSLPNFIVRRKDGVPAYQLASIVDDLHFQVSHVIRGADLISSTLAQQWLAQQLGWADFQKIHFLHHPLIMDERGEKLSKSAGSGALRSLSAETGPESIFKQVATLLNISPEGIPTANDLLKALHIALNKTP